MKMKDSNNAAPCEFGAKCSNISTHLIIHKEIGKRTGFSRLACYSCASKIGKLNIPLIETEDRENDFYKIMPLSEIKNEFVFYKLPEIKSQQEIQKRNPFFSDAHRKAHQEMCNIAKRYGVWKKFKDAGHDIYY